MITRHLPPCRAPECLPCWWDALDEEAAHIRDLHDPRVWWADGQHLTLPERVAYDQVWRARMARVSRIKTNYRRRRNR
ncbi:hypothetical protein [Streptosporangium sp. V21-05]|uniref:hypothetical protein n=1 Tax=Streptosporangium sp. V21-05 TaxID=3446115 RepID=UPI003F5352CA